MPKSDFSPHIKTYQSSNNLESFLKKIKPEIYPEHFSGIIKWSKKHLIENELRKPLPKLVSLGSSELRFNMGGSKSLRIQLTDAQSSTFLVNGKLFRYNPNEKAESFINRFLKVAQLDIKPAETVLHRLLIPRANAFFCLGACISTVIAGLLVVSATGGMAFGYKRYRCKKLENKVAKCIELNIRLSQATSETLPEADKKAGRQILSDLIKPFYWTQNLSCTEERAAANCYYDLYARVIGHELPANTKKLKAISSFYHVKLPGKGTLPRDVNRPFNLGKPNSRVPATQ